MTARGKQRPSLLTGSVPGHLVRLSWPMVFGILSFIGFNLADTWFVAQLGPDHLSAISFTFPVTMVLFSVTLGLGIGLTSVMSRSLGSGDRALAKRLTNSTLLLGLVLVAAATALGLATIDPVFRMIGAPDHILPLIHDYMVIWYSSVIFMVLPMVGNSAMRALGDALTPSMLMVGAAIVNVILDPIMIFGLLGFPRLEMIGAGLATLTARFLTLLVVMAVLHFREKLLDLRPGVWAERLADWKAVMKIATPVIAGQLVGPISFAILTALVADYGSNAVGGLGIASRIEAFALIPILALQTGMTPMVGQNHGAALHHRVRTVLHWGFGAAVVWGALLTAVLGLLAVPIAELFDEDPQVVTTAAKYLYITPVTFAFYGLLLVATAAFNALGRAVPAMILTVLRMLVIQIPLALLLEVWFDLTGIFIAVAAANVITGALAVIMILRQVPRGDPNREAVAAGSAT